MFVKNRIDFILFGIFPRENGGDFELCSNRRREGDLELWGILLQAGAKRGLFFLPRVASEVGKSPALRRGLCLRVDYLSNYYFAAALRAATLSSCSHGKSDFVKCP